MQPTVHILVSHLEGAELSASLLVFKTLRIGFPTLPVTVWANSLSLDDRAALKQALGLNQSSRPIRYFDIPKMAHDVWLTRLVGDQQEPFWICDTDIVFHQSVEGFVNAETLLKGRFEPAFVDPWSKTHKTERLHTSLLYVNAPEIRVRRRAWIRRWHPDHFPFTPQVELIRQCYIPHGAGQPPIFQDTAAGLWLALGGDKFSDEENAAFDHLHCGTYLNRIGDFIPGLGEAHAAVLKNPAMAPMMREPQKQFYKQNSIPLCQE